MTTVSPASTVATGARSRGTLTRVTIVAFFRRLLRTLQPSGNRSSIETEYRQPNAPGISGGPNPPSGHVPGGYVQN